MSLLQKLSMSLEVFRRLGVDYVVAAAKPGVSLQVAKVTQAGASPYLLTFSACGLSEMADAAYDVVVKGPNGDEGYASRTTKSFTITGGADTEVHTVLVIGRLKGQATAL